MITKVAFAAVMLLTAGAASAGEVCKKILFWTVCEPTFPRGPVAAPEFDLSTAVTALTLILGGLAVLRSRRRRSPK